ncbi:MAG: translocation/assembly module TamB domain-containing protein [Deltaproteobacteria bacterium]|nr:translocation/assembly module TamB domain-containing protein [Deltaproteobacteria bacterium]
MKRIVSLFLVILILSFSSFVYLTKQPFFQQYLKRLVYEYAEKEFKRKIEFKTLSIGFLGPTIYSDEVSVSKKNESLFLKSIKARVSILALLKGQFKISSIYGYQGKFQSVLENNKGQGKPPDIFGSFLIPKFEFEKIDFEIKSQNSDEIFISNASIEGNQKSEVVFLKLNFPKINFKYKNLERTHLSLNVRGDVSPKRIYLKNFLLKENNNKLNLSGYYHFNKKQKLDIQFDSNFDVKSLHDILPQVKILSGHGRSVGSLKGILDAPVLQFSSQFESIFVGPQELKEAQFSFLLKDKVIQITNLESYKTVRGGVEIKLSDPLNVRGSLHLSQTPLENIYYLKELGILGKATGPVKFVIDGNQKYPAFLESDLLVEGFQSPVGQVVDIQNFQLSAKYSIGGEGLLVESGKINRGKTVWKIKKSQVGFGARPLHFEITSENYRWADFPLSPIKESFDAQGHVRVLFEGKTKDLKIESSFDLNNIKFLGLSCEGLQSKISFNKSILTILEAKAFQEDSFLSLNGQYDFIEKEFKNTKIHSNKVSVKDFIQAGVAIPFSLEGLFEVDLNVQGSLTRKNIFLEGEIKGRNTRILKESFEKVSISFSQKNGKTFLKKSQFSKGGGVLNISGVIFENNECLLDFKTENFVSQSFDFLSQYPFFISARVDFLGSLRGNIFNPKGKAKLHFSKSNLNGEALKNSTYEMSLENKSLNVKGEVFEGEASLTSQIKLDAPYFYKIHLQGKNFNFKPFYGLIRGFVSEGVGIIDGSILAEGSLESPLVNTLEVKINKFKINLPGYFLESKTPFQVSYKNNELEVGKVYFFGTETEFVFSGKKDKNGTLDFDGKGALNIAFLPLFVKEVERGSGLLNVSFSLKGSAENPLLLGYVRTENSSIRSRTLKQGISNLNLDIKLHNQEIIFEKAIFDLPRGKAKLGGNVLLSKIREPEFNISLELEKGRISFFEDLFSTMSGTLFLEGKSPFLIRGDLEVSKIEYERYLDWKSNIIPLTKKGEIKVSGENKEPTFNFDLKIKSISDLEVENNLFQLQGSGVFEIKGNNLNPVILGHFDTQKGKIFFKDHTFQLGESQLILKDKTKINPFFSFTLSGVIRDYRITIIGQGDLVKYNIQLQSDPPLAQTDIVSLLTLGVLTAEIQGEEALGTTSFEAATLILSQFQEKIAVVARKTLGVQFRLASSYSDTKHAVRPRLFLSKDLSDRLELSFSSTLDREGIFEDKLFNLEWRLNRRLSLLGVWEDEGSQETNQESIFGLDVKYKYEFE